MPKMGYLPFFGRLGTTPQASAKVEVSTHGYLGHLGGGYPCTPEFVGIFSVFSGIFSVFSGIFSVFFGILVTKYPRYLGLLGRGYPYICYVFVCRPMPVLEAGESMVNKLNHVVLLRQMKTKSSPSLPHPIIINQDKEKIKKRSRKRIHII
jgi:hypothetical protein